MTIAPIVTLLLLVSPTEALTLFAGEYPDGKICGDAIPEAVSHFFPNDTKTMYGWRVECEPTSRLSRSPIPPLRKDNP